MSHVKHILMSCLLALAATQVQATKQIPTEKVDVPAQPVSPFTITVKQTGTPSWKTFYKVPIKISIKNNS